MDKIASEKNLFNLLKKHNLSVAEEVLNTISAEKNDGYVKFHSLQKLIYMYIYLKT